MNRKRRKKEDREFIVFDLPWICPFLSRQIIRQCPTVNRRLKNKTKIIYVFIHRHPAASRNRETTSYALKRIAFQTSMESRLSKNDLEFSVMCNQSRDK